MYTHLCLLHYIFSPSLKPIADMRFDKQATVDEFGHGAKCAQYESRHPKCEKKLKHVPQISNGFIKVRLH